MHQGQTGLTGPKKKQGKKFLENHPQKKTPTHQELPIYSRSQTSTVNTHLKND